MRAHSHLSPKAFARLQARIETRTTGRSIRERAATRRQPDATTPAASVPRTRSQQPCNAP